MMSRTGQIRLTLRARVSAANALLPRLTAAFRDGRTGRRFPFGAEDVSSSAFCAYLAGCHLTRGERSHAMAMWRNARFVAGTRHDLELQGISHG